MNQDEINARRQSVQTYARLQKLEAERAALSVELRDRVMFDYLFAVCESYRQGRLGSHKFGWSKTRPDFWGHDAKVRAGSDKIVAYAWLDRNPVDAHRKYITVYEDGLVLVGPGWTMPEDYPDIVKLFDDHKAEQLRTLLDTARAVVRRDAILDEPATPPFSVDELKQVTTAYLHGY